MSPFTKSERTTTEVIVLPASKNGEGMEVEVEMKTNTNLVATSSSSSTTRFVPLRRGGSSSCRHLVYRYNTMCFVLVATLAVGIIGGVVTAAERERERSRMDRNSIRGSSYQRPDRSIPSSSSSSSLTQINSSSSSSSSSNSNSNSNSNSSSSSSSSSSSNVNVNNVLVPQCDPTDPTSYYNSNANALVDTTTNCDRFVEYCDKSMSTLSSPWSGGQYIFPTDFYSTVELLYERCFKTCSDFLNPNGSAKFCAMPNALATSSSTAETTAETASFNSASHSNPSYCSAITTHFTAVMIKHENEVLRVLNQKRKEPNGIRCTTAGQSIDYPPSSPVQMNESLRCAARLQAKNIVDATLQLAKGQFPANLHTACPSSSSRNICEDFSTRTSKAGYEYRTQGFGSLAEVTAAGYTSPSATIAGWIASPSGHCDSIMKQESLVITTEVGIGYYEDSATGSTAHVMILSQRKL